MVGELMHHKLQDALRDFHCNNLEELHDPTDPPGVQALCGETRETVQIMHSIRVTATISCKWGRHRDVRQIEPQVDADDSNDGMKDETTSASPPAPAEPRLRRGLICFDWLTRQRRSAGRGLRPNRFCRSSRRVASLLNSPAPARPPLTEIS